MNPTPREEILRKTRARASRSRSVTLSRAGGAQRESTTPSKRHVSASRCWCPARRRCNQWRPRTA